jgi:hypothetical protein
MVREPAAFGGAYIRCQTHSDYTRLDALLHRLRLEGTCLRAHSSSPHHEGVHLCLLPKLAERWMPGFDTLGLKDTLGRSESRAPFTLEQEIALCVLGSPMGQDFPSVDEFEAHLRIRRNTAIAAARSSLRFDPMGTDRPGQYWDFSEDTGFTLREGTSLLQALSAATQPARDERGYSFSCYRATEYIMLLGVAQELAKTNHALFVKLEQQCRRSIPRADDFQATFLRETGTADSPVPMGFYIPGDRVWFKNPDDTSSDVLGYEGSWVIYLGRGRFSNLWKRDAPFTLYDKCIEIFHWRNSVRTLADGALSIDEALVEKACQATKRNPAQAAVIIDRMMRYRDPSGVYEDGGCIDRTREGPRFVCPQHCDLVLSYH